MNIVKSKNVKTPNRGTSKSAGIDFFIPNDFEKCYLKPHQSIVIDSGIYAKIPNGKTLVFMNKSGVAVNRDLRVGACVIDEDFQGEILIHLTNVGESNIWLAPGEKIVQGLLIDADYQEINVIDSVGELYIDDDSERGNGCLGHTGIH